MADRTRLTADATIYAGPNGDDSWTGDAQNPLRTLARAHEIAVNDIDPCGHRLTLQLADGQYDGIGTSQGMIGGNANEFLIIAGNASDKGAVIVNGGAGDAFQLGAGSGGRVGLIIQDMTITAPQGTCIGAYGNGTGVTFRRVRFGAAQVHVKAAHGAELNALQNYEVVAGCAYHAMAEVGGRIVMDGGTTVTYQNYPTFSACNFYCADGSMYLGGMTFVNGQWTVGTKFVVVSGGKIFTGSGINYLPGSVAGYIQNGSLYT